MPFDNVFDTPLVDYPTDFEKSDIRYLESLPHLKRIKIPFIILKNTAYQLVLDKYLQLYEQCWRHGDEDGNNNRFAQCLGYNNGLQLHEIDAVAERLIMRPFDNPTKEEAKEFFKQVYMGELEFACRMHIINGYTAFDLAKGYYLHYEKGETLEFEKRYEFKDMIFLPD